MLFFHSKHHTSERGESELCHYKIKSTGLFVANTVEHILVSGALLSTINKGSIPPNFSLLVFVGITFFSGGGVSISHFCTVSN